MRDWSMRGFYDKAEDIVTNNEDKMASSFSIASYLALVNILSNHDLAWESFLREAST